MIRRPPRSTPLYSSAASDVYKRQGLGLDSIDALQFIVGIEKEFNVTLPSEDINVYRSINSVTDFLLANNPVQAMPGVASGHES